MTGDAGSTGGVQIGVPIANEKAARAVEGNGRYRGRARGLGGFQLMNIFGKQLSPRILIGTDHFRLPLLNAVKFAAHHGRAGWHGDGCLTAGRCGDGRSSYPHRIAASVTEHGFRPLDQFFDQTGSVRIPAT